WAYMAVDVVFLAAFAFLAWGRFALAPLAGSSRPGPWVRAKAGPARQDSVPALHQLSGSCCPHIAMPSRRTEQGPGARPAGAIGSRTERDAGHPPPGPGVGRWYDIWYGPEFSL